jgi:hypothetical protein
MKHKLTVLACIGLALLLTSGAAFAQNTVTVVGGTLARCAANQPVQVQISNAGTLGAIGLPLSISGGATISGATAGPLLAGFTTAVGGFPGTAGVLNAVGGSLAPGANQLIWTLQVSTPASCGAVIVIDTAFYPPAGAFVLNEVGCCAAPQPGFNAGSFTMTNSAPTCGVNSNESVNFAGSINKQLNASDPDVCDNPLTYALVNAGGLNGTAAVSASGMFTYSASCADKGVHTVTFSATDACNASVQCTFDVTVTNDAPTCGVNSNENVYFANGVVNKQLNGGDASNPVTFSLVSIVPPNVGPASVSPAGVFNYATVCGDVGNHTVTFKISDGCDSVNCSFQVSVFQNAPVPTCPANASVDWAAANQVYVLNATDDGCTGSLTWSIVSVIPAAQNAPSVLGNQLTFDPDCADVPKGPIAITVRVSDGLLTADCSFSVTVTNDNPLIVCPADEFAVLGDLVSAQAGASDDPNNNLTFSLVSFTGLEGQGAPTNAPSFSATGEFSWQTSDASNNDAGLWEACIRVEDGCGGSDECCFQIDVLSYALCIRSELDSVNAHALSGQQETVYITLSNSYPLGGIDLLVCYDVSGLTFLGAESVDELSNWEYFTWRHSPNSNCQGSCPCGYVRIIGIADLDNGPDVHPDDADFYLDGQIVALTFQVISDRNFINQCFNVGFCVLDCGDNALSSKSGDTLFIPIGSDQSCIDSTKYEARDIIEFCPGRICIDEPPDDRGDINLNGLANEIGDAVLLTNYFVYGSSVWDPVWEDVQILATDINDDGIVLTVADLIYLIRIITGDEQPFPPGTGNGSPKLSPYANSGMATLRVENNNVSVSTSSNVELGGALLVFRMNGLSTGEPSLLSGAAGMNLRYNANGSELRVLVHPSWEDELATIGSGSNEILSIPTSGDGTIELVEVQMSDSRGALMSTTAASVALPTSYALQQNYPNPFNAGTVMAFDLVGDANWTLTIYNVAGQTVREFNGLSGAGTVRVPWDGRTNEGAAASSGVYFYRVTANGFSATKKMTLMK